jgi:drug/metabolite transporter (DMT)-like permease
MTAPAALPAPPPDRTLAGIAMMACFALFGPVIDTFAKLATDIPVGQISAARFAVQAAMLLPLAAALGALHRPDWPEMRLHLVRGGLITVATMAFFAAVQVMPIADAIAIFFVEPFLLTLLGHFMLGETIGWRRVLACLIGFGGALLVIRPSFSAFGWVSALPLVTALMFAFYMALTRRMAQAMNPITLQAYTALAACVLVVPALALAEGSGIAALDPVWPEGRNWLWLLGVGLAATVAHLFISFALSFAPAATIAPLQYLEIVSATVLGYLIFGDFPDAQTFLGVGIIVGAGLYVFVRERGLSRRPLPPP